MTKGDRRGGETRRSRKPEEPAPLKLRQLLAKGRFRLANIHLVEAEKLLGRGDTPNACVHACYYAMHHAAAAALLVSGGVGKRRLVPNSHEAVIEHYAKLVAPEDGALNQSAEWLNYARACRVTADYGVQTAGASPRDASENLANAKAFFATFATKWRVDLPADKLEDQHLTHNLEIALREDEGEQKPLRGS